jgi:hypothetical protein
MLFALVHGAWPTGKELEPLAASAEAAGHRALTPTIRGNRPGDPKTVGLAEAIHERQLGRCRRGRARRSFDRAGALSVMRGTGWLPAAFPSRLRSHSGLLQTRFRWRPIRAK